MDFRKSLAFEYNGRLDALVETASHIYIFEFKLDGSAQEALHQIQEKAYWQPFLHGNKKCIGVGMSFSKQDKKVKELVWKHFS